MTQPAYLASEDVSCEPSNELFFQYFKFLFKIKVLAHWVEWEFLCNPKKYHIQFLFYFNEKLEQTGKPKSWKLFWSEIR